MATKKKPGAKVYPNKRVGAEKDLTPKQEHMVQQYLLHGLKYKAYQTAYDIKSSCRIYDKAWVEFNKLNIKRRVKELQDKAVYEHLVTKDILARELNEARDLALTSRAPAAAVKATLAKAKLYGHVIDKIQQEVIGAAGSPLIPQNVKIRVIHVNKDDVNKDKDEQ